jgi:thioredoxin 1
MKDENRKRNTNTMKRIIIIQLLLLLILAIGCTEAKQEPIVSADSTSTEVSRIQITFMEFGSKTCIPCKQMVPVMAAIEEKYPELVKVEFYDVMKQANKAISKQYNIKTIPTQIFLDERGNEFFRHQGFFPEEEIVKLLENRGIKAE